MKKLSLNHYEIKLQNHFYLDRFFYCIDKSIFFLFTFTLLSLSLEEQRVILAYNANVLSNFTLN